MVLPEVDDLAEALATVRAGKPTFPSKYYVLEPSSFVVSSQPSQKNHCHVYDAVVKPVSSLQNASFFFFEVQLYNPWLIFRGETPILHFGDIDPIFTRPQIFGAAVE